MRVIAILFSLFIVVNLSHAQNTTFASITDLESDFTPGNVAARMVEGLGFRYYWASEGLGAEDLKFGPVEEGRNSRATVDHIYNLSRFLLSALEKKVFEAGNPREMSFANVRNETLNNLEKAVKILKSSKQADFADYNIKFNDGREMPFWNAINGPIADAIYHTGQIVLMRRMSGNPINPNISVLTGNVR
ncbi:DinB family protein [Roseivirga misakiensis]|uniref:DinB-like domain-containing protein n=1 Tax=Roseivirga misakiensis TaxID=1563681 RepID=A0A1E5T129_9BACT|nr:hypothetical protein [Roseivirga misakiensis]OEK05078.1 hypothetical protein BFP71_16810 [Roseivirga misakiensis]